MKLAALVVVLAGIPAVGHADSLRVATADYDEPPVVPPGMTPVIVVEPEVDAPPPPVSAIAAQNQIVASQRNFLSGTALTVPAGRVELTAKSAIVVNGVSIAAGLTSTTEVWADIYGVIDEGGGVYGLGLKQVLARGGTWQLAATASVRGGSDGADDEKIGTLGGVFTVCTESCTAMASAGVTVLFTQDDSEALPIYTGGLSIGGATARLLGEVMMASENGQAEGLGFLGVRFGSRKYAVDLGLIKLVGEGDNDLIPLPMLSVAGRM